MAGMVPEDIYELAGAIDPRLSPDGRTVACSVWSIDREKNDYRSAIWLAAVDGASPPRRFTAGQKRDSIPRWSPDGDLLAFTSNRDKNEPQLFVMPASGGEPAARTDLKEGVGEVAWSPDGELLAFSSRVPDPAYEEKDDKKRAPRRFTRLQYKLDNEGWTADRPQHLFVVPVEGKEVPRQLTFGDYEDSHPAWSPDGRRIAFASARHDDWDMTPGRDIYIVDREGGDPERVTGSDGFSESPSWSPDGTRIAYLFTPGIWDDPRHTQVAVVDVGSGERRLLTESLDRKCSPYPAIREPVWDGDEVLFAVEDRGNCHLYRVAADGSSAPEPVTRGDGQVTGFDAVDGRIVHSFTTATGLSELYEGERRLTDVGTGFADGRELAAPERFVATSADGTEVEAWIMRPADLEPGRRFPVLLNIHGGPYTQYGNRFFDEFQVYSGGGYAVVYGNPRGSSGYGEDFARAIRVSGDGEGWGSVDYQDCMAIIDEAIRRFDFCDPERVGVIGGSYGGYMTSWIVGHTDRFKAAVSERAVNSFVSMWGSSDFGWDLKGYFGSFLFEDFDTHVRLSPLTYAQNITTPVLILHSENDLRCPIEQGEQLFVTLRLLKREVEFVRFPGESHELTRSGSPHHRVARFDIVLDWFDRHLKKDGSLESSSEGSPS
jgi:dipeptidyl aminopeptidase/acylaminoacyl peptidase